MNSTEQGHFLMTTMSIKSLKSVAIAAAAALLATGSVAVHADARSPEYAAARKMQGEYAADALYREGFLNFQIMSMELRKT